MPYKFVEKLTRADVAFECESKTLSELFEDSAQALFEIMCNPKKIESKITKEFVLENDTLEKLLFNFLDEIIFLKDSESMLFNSCTVEFVDDLKLKATLTGDKVSLDQELRVDAKAVTMHKFEAKKTEKGYFARVIIDI
ncbi:archease [Candidatus Woesearchaeota archaeon]|nr:archease [Candidatus Woesearchaeota archaeon]